MTRFSNDMNFKLPVSTLQASRNTIWDLRHDDPKSPELTCTVSRTCIPRIKHDVYLAKLFLDAPLGIFPSLENGSFPQVKLS